MVIYGPHTGDVSKSVSYTYGPHWKGIIGYRVIEGNDIYGHKFGGESWDVPTCLLCNEPIHQIFSFDLKDTRLKELGDRTICELPLICCLNCSVSWEPQAFKINFQNRSVDTISQNYSQKWVREEADKIRYPLPEINVKLIKMVDDDIPIDEASYYKALSSFGKEYICSLVDPLVKTIIH